MPPVDWIGLLTEATDGFAAELEGGDLAAPVPTCPGWTLADLGEHLRVTHAWAAHAVVEGNPDGMPEPGPLDRDGLVAGYRAAAARLIDVLARTPEDAPVWAFGPKPRVALFWRRRQVHEATMHRYDALSASGREADWSISPELAWDGVDEVATVFYPRQVRLERTEPLAGVLRLVPTDLDASPIEIGAGDPVVEVTDTAARLLLMLWRRIDAPAEVSALTAGHSVTP
jgi:uncharacterized protein (TIGR03083 family)